MGSGNQKYPKTSFFLMVLLASAYQSQAEELTYIWNHKFISCSDMVTPKQAIRVVQYIRDHKEADKITFFGGNLDHLPDDALASNKFTEVEFWHSRMEEVPYRLINPVGGSLRKLIFYSVDMTDKTIYFGGFQHCGQLQHLSMTNCDLQAINPKAFIGLSNLKHLDLSGNALTRLYRGTFEGLNSLNILKLQSARLELLDDGVFEPIQDTIIAVDLSDNPLQCDCSLQWLKDWFRERKSKKSAPNFINTTDNITCSTPVWSAFETLNFCNKTSTSPTPLTSSQTERKTDQPCACLLRKLLEQAMATLQQDCTNQKNDHPSCGLAEKSNNQGREIGDAVAQNRAQ